MMIFSKINRNKFFFQYFFTGLFLIFFAVILKVILLHQEEPTHVTGNFSAVLHLKERSLRNAIEQMNGYTFVRPNQRSNRLESEFGQFADKNGFVLFVYEQDSLVYWSTNAVSCPEHLKKIILRDTNYFERQKNGWYEVFNIIHNKRVYVGQILIKQQYPFENEYLQNNFQHEFRVPDGVVIGKIGTPNTIFSDCGKPLFSLKFSKNPVLSQTNLFIIFLLYLAGFIFLIISLYQGYKAISHFFSSPLVFILSFAIDVILIRLVQFYFRIPFDLYDSKLFGPSFFSSSPLLPSLGDLFVNSILFLLIAYVFYKNFRGVQPSLKEKKFVRISIAFIFITIILTAFGVIIYLIHLLVVDSTIPFNLQDVSSLNFFSIIGCIIISSLFLSFFLVGIQLTQSVFDLVGLSFVKYKRGKKLTEPSLSWVVIYLIFFAVTGTIMINHFNASVEREKRKMIALKLGTSRDAMAEVMFSKIQKNITNDWKINAIISDTIVQNAESVEDSIERYLKSTYFRGFWNNYTFQATICTKQKNLRVQPQNNLINCNKYFQTILNEYGKTTLSSNFFFLDYGYGYKNYLAFIPVLSEVEEPAKDTLYVEISSKLIFKDIGYPELLIDKNEGQIPDLSDYSYAYYRFNKLTHRVGNAQYNLELDSVISQNINACFYSNNGYSHYFYPIDSNNTLIISRKDSTFLDNIAPFSYLFFFFSLFSILFFIIIRFEKVINISFLKLSDRLQISMSGILAISLLITGGLLIYYIIRLNNAKNLENLNERTHSLLIALQHKISNSSDFSLVGPNGLNDMMTEFSNVFFADVNLYSPEGRLMATSRPEIFEEGLSSKLMNREAFSRLRYFHNSYYFHNEKIGENGFSSAYIPFFNDRNKLLAYLNLPYFARQDDLKKEISAFLVTFINVYVVLVIVGIFLSLVVSNYISRPLRILALRISQLSFGKHNEKIAWKRKDEIGQLVDQYNLMIDELVTSAGLLAKSEREMAWREMAKQVAHEIKNPLTPMKLSVQYLEKAWDDKTPDWDERLKKFTATMTEQIDTLSLIASEFSDFAKMPVTQSGMVNLNEILENVKALYQDSLRIHFEFQYDAMEPHNIIADKKQLIRVFTNLVNNAVQAIGNKKDGMIIINLERVYGTYRIKIADNGEGISSELSEKIFQPNFTTKSGGMGLGLAIVKSIINGLGGEIAFESGGNTGTTFILVFNVPEEANQATD